MACLKNPNALETLLETALTCSFQSKEQSICTKVFSLFDYFKLIIVKFQSQVFNLTFENALFLLGRNMHGMGFRNFQGKLVAL